MANLYQDFEALSGTYGKLYEGSKWLAQFHSIETNFEHNYEDIPQAGNTSVGGKYTGTTYTGTMTCIQYESEFIERVLVLGPEQRPAVLDLLVTVEDPAAIGAYKVMLKGVKITSGSIINFEHGSPVEQEFEFRFNDVEVVQGIKAR